MRENTKWNDLNITGHKYKEITILKIKHKNNTLPQEKTPQKTDYKIEPS